VKLKQNREKGESKMLYSRVNSSAATLTKNRTEGSITPSSGMCVTCVDGWECAKLVNQRTADTR